MVRASAPGATWRGGAEWRVPGAFGVVSLVKERSTGQFYAMKQAGVQLGAEVSG
jgi:hypothetical protein